MKYLQLYEYFSNPGFKEITEEEFELFVFGEDNNWDNWDRFTEIEENEIKKVFPKDFRRKINVSLSSGKYSPIDDFKYFVIENTNTENTIEIFKLTDEWFGVKELIYNHDTLSVYNQTTNTYFKCDQIVGLVKLLKGLTNNFYTVH